MTRRVWSSISWQIYRCGISFQKIISGGVEFIDSRGNVQFPNPGECRPSKNLTLLSLAMAATFWKLFPDNKMDDATWRLPENIPLNRGWEAHDPPWWWWCLHFQMIRRASVTIAPMFTLPRRKSRPRSNTILSMFGDVPPASASCTSTVVVWRILLVCSSKKMNMCTHWHCARESLITLLLTELPVWGILAEDQYSKLMV